MKVLLDTNICIWASYEPSQLSQKAQEILSNEANVLFLSSISLAEIAIKTAIGKLNLPQQIDTLRQALVRELKVVPIMFDFHEAVHLVKLPLIHRDPFDRMLICQAIVHDLTILTPDKAIAQYQDVVCIW